MAKWKEYKIKDAPFEIIDGDRGKNYPTQNEFYSNGHCLFLSAKNVKKTGFDFSERQFVSEEKDNLLRKGKLKRNDTVLTTRGTVGNLAFYGDEVPFENIRINSGMVIIRPFENELKPKFCFYLFRALQQNHFEVFASGSAQPQLPIRDLNEIEISIPEPDEQQAIAEVLSRLDGKIDLLYRQNKTLEALAEVLFRQWFVVEAEESWETTSLFDVVELVGGGTPKTDIAEYWDGGIKWISAKDITPNHKRFIVDTEKKITEQGLTNSSARLLPKYATIISARGTVGNYCILSESMAFSQSNYGIKPRFKDYYFFTYLLIANAVEELQSAAYGSVFDTITTSTFKEHQIKIPNQKEIQNFDEKVKPYFDKMLSNEFQIRSLTKLRDTLLPKLMSGEVSVAVD
jgi:type I restriction enzyme S subunit